MKKDAFLISEKRPIVDYQDRDYSYLLVKRKDPLVLQDIFMISEDEINLF